MVWFSFDWIEVPILGGRRSFVPDGCLARGAKVATENIVMAYSNYGCEKGEIFVLQLFTLVVLKKLAAALSVGSLGQYVKK